MFDGHIFFSWMRVCQSPFLNFAYFHFLFWTKCPTFVLIFTFDCTFLSISLTVGNSSKKRYIPPPPAITYLPIHYPNVWQPVETFLFTLRGRKITTLPQRIPHIPWQAEWNVMAPPVAIFCFNVGLWCMALLPLFKPINYLGNLIVAYMLLIMNLNFPQKKFAVGFLARKKFPATSKNDSWRPHLISLCPCVCCVCCL